MSFPRSGVSATPIRHLRLLRQAACSVSTAQGLRRAAAPRSAFYRHRSEVAAMSTERSFPALFVRGGTSNGLVILRRDLPPQEEWHRILPAAMGSPDPYGRQLDGMGSGLSSTSKICVLSPSTRPDADVDFTFVQVGIRDGSLDLAGNCGNMSSAVGPMAWDEGLVSDMESKIHEPAKAEVAATAAATITRGSGNRDDTYEEAVVRFFNTNTNKIVHSRFRVTSASGAGASNDNVPTSDRSPLSSPKVRRYCPDGDYEMEGVPGTQSRITLSFLRPGGAKTGRSLPTGNAVDELALPDGSRIAASLVDVSNPGVFVRLRDLLLLPLLPTDEEAVVSHSSSSSSSSSSSLPSAHDITPIVNNDDPRVRAFTPQRVEADQALKQRLEMIRQAGAEKMGLDPRVESVPKIVILFPGPPATAPASGPAAAVLEEKQDDQEGYSAGPSTSRQVDIRCLALSMGQAHKAVPLTLALCLGAAANFPGTLAAELMVPPQGGLGRRGGSVVIGHPSGRVEVGTTIGEDGEVQSAELHRTARLLMKGRVSY